MELLPYAHSVLYLHLPQFATRNAKKKNRKCWNSTHLVEVKRVNLLCRIDVRQRCDVDIIRQGIKLVGDVPQLPGALQIETGRQIPIVGPRLIRVPEHGRSDRQYPHDLPLRFSLRVKGSCRQLNADRLRVWGDTLDLNLFSC